MKTITRFWAAAAVFAGLFTACSDLDDIKNKVDELDGRLTALETITTNLNKNIEAMQALYSGATVNSATQKDGVWTVVLSNGETLTLNQGSIGVANAPVMSVDKDGYWMVDYDGAEGNAPSYILTGENKVQATGTDGKTPKFAVDAEKFWTVSYDGGTIYERVLGADGQPVKAIQDGQAQDPYFSDVKLEGGHLKVTLKTGEELTVAVVPDFLCAIEATGLQQFNAGETKPYNVTIKGVSSTMITAPAGWTATLSEPVDNKAVLTVTAPVLTKAVIADSKSDVCILAFSEKGFATIAKVNVSVSAEPEGDGPAVDDEPVVEVITDLYQAYLDGKEIEIAGVKYSKAVNGEATLLTATEAETNLRDDIHRKSGVFFLDTANDDASFTIATITEINGTEVVIIGRYTDKKTVLVPQMYFKFVAGGFALKNLTIDMDKLDASGSNNKYFINHSGTDDLTYLLFDDCKVINIKKNVLMTATNSCAYAIKKINIVDSDFEISGTSNVQMFNLYNSKVLAKFEEIVFDNNIVFNEEAGVCQVFNWGNGTEQTSTTYNTKVSFCNNTFYNAPSVNSHFKFEQVASLDVKKNLFWASETNVNSSNIFALYGSGQTATGIDVSDNIAYGLAEDKNWNLAHSNSTYKPEPNKLTKLESNPLATVDFTTYTFTPTAEYASYGAQR